MNLLDLFVKIGVKDEASSQLGSITSGMITKATLAADAIKSVAQTAANAMQSFMSSAISSYGNFEQLKGGMETFFGNSSDTVISNAKRAYETAGMSANQYMSNVSSFAMSLVNSVAKRRQNVVEQDTTAQKKALDTQVTNLERALSKQYSATSKALNKEYSELQKHLSKQVEAQQEANDEAYKSKQKQLDSEYKALQKKLDSDYKALQKELDDEVKAFEKATDEKIKEMERERDERLKILDEERDGALKAIDDQIDAIDAQEEAEDRARRRREQQQRISDLEYKAAHAKTLEDRAQAERELADARADMEEQERDWARQEQKKALREQREQLREQYSEQRDKLKDALGEQIEQYKEGRDNELSVMKESNQQKLEQQRENNQLQLEAQKEANDLELEQLKKSQDAQVKAMRESNEEILEAKRDLNEAILENLQDSNQRQIDAMRESVAAQKAALDEAAANQGEYIEITEEDRARAAEIADMAMKDMADNANKMGTNIESIEMAYQGFAKQNFTMLDNLRLGYGGTRSEMERLLDDAERIKAKNGEVVSYSIDSFADIVEAIHAVQEEVGVTGTTAEEGATTIEGAMFRARAAWENWLISLADPEWDVAESTEQLVDSVANAAGLIIPRVGEILQALFEEVSQKAPEIWNTFKEALMDALPEEWKERIGEFIAKLEQFYQDAQPVIEAVKTLGEWFVKTVEFLSPLIDAFNRASDAIGRIAPVVAGARVGFELFGAAALALSAPFSGAIALIGLVVGAIVGFVMSNEEARDKLHEIFDAIVGFFKDLATGAVNGLRDMVQGVYNGAQNVIRSLQNIPSSVTNVFRNAGSWLVNAGKNIMTGLYNGIVSGFQRVASYVTSIGSWIASHKGPESYDKALLVPAGRWIMGGLHEGLERAFEGEVEPYIMGLGESMQDAFGNPVLSAQYSRTMDNSQRMLTAQQPKQLNVILELDRVQFGKLVYQLNNDETQRVGVSLAGGYA